MGKRRRGLSEEEERDLRFQTVVEKSASVFYTEINSRLRHGQKTSAPPTDSCSQHMFL